MSKTGLRYCSRCKESVPLAEWKFSATLKSITHVGRDRRLLDGEYIGDDECGFIEKVPIGESE